MDKRRKLIATPASDQYHQINDGNANGGYQPPRRSLKDPGGSHAAKQARPARMRSGKVQRVLNVRLAFGSRPGR